MKLAVGNRKKDENEILTEIKNFCERYSKNQFIITCRTAAQIAVKKLKFKNFIYVEIADFSDEQIKIFAKKWFLKIDKNNGKKIAKEFIEKLNNPENKQIREISITPILLSLTCWVFTGKKKFPSKRHELYRDGLELLLEEWDEAKGIKRDEIYRNLTLYHKKKLLNHLATEFFKRNEYFFIKDDIQLLIAEYIDTLSNNQADLDELFEDSKTILKLIELQHGLIVERAKDIYSFSHLTFQEYLIASNIKSSSSQNNFSQLINHITNGRWREIFLLVDEMLPNSGFLWQQVKQYVDSILASELKLQEFLTWIEQKSRSARAIQLVNNPYKENSIRVFYFSYHLSLNTDIAVTLDPKLTSAHNLSLDFQRSPKLDSVRDLAIARQVERNLALDIVLYHALYHQELNTALDVAIDRSIDRNSDTSIDIELANSLNEELIRLKNQLPNRGKFTNSQERQEWTEKLRNVMIDYRNIGKNWHFSEEEKKLLNQYYDANKLLVDCLNNASQVSLSVKKEIKDTLLLPINNIN